MPEGQYIHLDLVSTDPKATRAFFEAAFGWKFPPSAFGEYALWEAPGAPHGGLRRQEGGEPPGLIGYLAVDSLADAEPRIAKAGGRILGPVQEVPGFGRLLLFEAPGGIVQGVFEEAR